MKLILINYFKIKISEINLSHFYLILLYLFTFSLVSCNPVSTKLDEDFNATLTTSLEKSSLSTSGLHVNTYESLEITLMLKDQNGSNLITSKKVVSFTHTGGTSIGSFGSVINNGDGTYTTNFTGVSAGTPTTIHAKVDGAKVTNSLKSIQVKEALFSISNSIISTANSVVSNSSVNVTLTLKDYSNSQLLEGGAPVIFSHSGGSSTGVFSAVTDNLNGTYSATFTGVNAGSPTTISATVYGALITSTAPTIKVVANIPDKIDLFSGNAQVANAGSALALPIIVVVKDLNNNFVEGSIITWAVTAGGGALSNCSPVTNSSGLAQCTLTLGTSVGPNAVKATINGTSIITSFNAMAVVGPVSLSQSSFTISSASIVSNDTATLTVVLKDSFGNQIPDATKAGSITISILATGTSTGAISGITPVNGNPGVYEATFTALTAGTINTMKASYSGIDFTSFNPSFTVTFGAATKLSFIQTPTNATIGAVISPSITIRALDINNNFVSNYSANINISIATNPSGGTLSGTISKAAIGGIATFNDLQINYFGSGYTLKASSGALTDTISGGFNINSSAQTDSESIVGSMSAGTGASGVVLDTLTGTTIKGLKLGNSGTCNGLAMDCAKSVAPEIYELNSIWILNWTSNLVSYWKMNQSSWSDALDEVFDSKGVNHGRAKNGATTSSASKMGSHSGEFNGTNQYISASSFNGLTALNAVTISHWAKFNTLTGIQDFVSTYSGSGFEFRQNNGQLEFEITNGGVFNCATTTASLTAGAWYFLSASYDKSNINIYINGILNKTCPQTVSLPTTSSLTLGARDSSFNFFNGALDEVAIWSSALSAAEIFNIFNRQKFTHSGVFFSRVMNAGSSSNWDKFSWMPTLPFYKELPDSGGMIQNEVQVDYSSLHDNGLPNNLMNKVEGLWHFNDAVGTKGAASVKDDSGKNKHADASNNIIFGSIGKLATAAELNKLNNDNIKTPKIDFTGTQTISVSFWLKIVEDNTYEKMVLELTENFNFSTGGFLFYLDPTPDVLVFGSCTAGQGRAGLGMREYGYNFKLFDRPVDGQWHHFSFILDKSKTSESEITIYIDGSLAKNQEQPLVNESVQNFDIDNIYLMSRASEGIYTSGSIDELAIWSRAISEFEVKQLYQRGASRLKFQVQTCSLGDSSCTSAAWRGPDGTNATFFSELNNNSAVDGSGDVKASLPLMLSTQFPLAPANNPYFRYRAIFESDSPLPGLMPELKSVTADPMF